MKHNKGRAKSIYFKIAIVAVILISGIAAYYISINSKVKAWETRIYPGISISGVDIGGKTKEEALQLLKDEVMTKLGEKEINIKVGENKKTYKYSDLSATYDVEKSAEEALNYGKNLGVISKNNLINGKNNDKDDIELSFSYDEGKIQSISEKLKTENNVAPINASIKIDAGVITITPDIVGYELNDENLDSKIKEAINGEIGKSTDLSFEVQEIKAKITKEELAKIKNKPMSSFESNFASSDAARSNNVSLVTSLVNGIVLMPGEQFSYSEVSQKGRGKYQDAPVYINNKIEKAEGGGICQVSTTLYRAIMRANIRSTERLNHSLPVGYSEKGLDATVAWGNIDYKFKNTYDFPIYLEGTTNNNTVRINVYGDPDAFEGNTYDMKSEILSTIPPSITYTDDSAIPIGTTIVESAGQVGYKVKSYQITYKDGVEIKRDVVSTDTYASQPSIVRKGTATAVVPVVPGIVKSS